jgi:AbrB family looped-hinge helix DNA binding protein
MSAVLKVQERGQVTLPKDLRERLHIVPGTLLVCTEEANGDVRLTRVPKLTFEEMFGSWKNQPRTDGTEVEDEIRQAMEDAADEYLSRLDD